MVLAGGSDREREVSILSANEVEASLLEAGHDVLLRNIDPENLSALDEFAHWKCAEEKVIFPVLHGAWGEGGPLQRILDNRGLPYVGSGSQTSELCMDKHRTKLALERAQLPTPPYELLSSDKQQRLPPPVVIKALREGSSIDLMICTDHKSASRARRQLNNRHHKILVEKFISGKELTIGVIGKLQGDVSDQYRNEALPPIQILPATTYYDYEAKYVRNDTRYLFDPAEIGLPMTLLDELQRMSLAAHHLLGCRHLSRWDFIVDTEQQPWILEVNTMPGFTKHSLLPMAAAKAGIAMSALTNRLVRLAVQETKVVSHRG